MICLASYFSLPAKFQLIQSGIFRAHRGGLTTLKMLFFTFLVIFALNFTECGIVKTVTNMKIISVKCKKRATTTTLKVIYKGCFKFFVALYADRIFSDQHFVENRIEKFLFV